MEPVEKSLDALAALADDLRRRMYLFVRSRRRPVSRDEAAEAVGISRKLAAFHLDKLVDKGLLNASYTRLSGRRGPGAGRPSKVYEPTESEISVSVPSRAYEELGRLLLKALRAPDSAPARAALSAAAQEDGRELGQNVRTTKRLRATSDRKILETTEQVLTQRGYEPYTDEEGAIRLRNCPFHALAQESVELVCGMNQAFIDGLLDGLGADSPRAVLDPRPGECCVRIDAGGAA